VETAYRTRRFNAIYLGVDPVYDSIRQHPRFQTVLAGMGLGALLEDRSAPAMRMPTM
jgi:hypothetical protein